MRFVKPHSPATLNALKTNRTSQHTSVVEWGIGFLWSPFLSAHRGALAKEIYSRALRDLIFAAISCAQASLAQLTTTKKKGFDFHRSPAKISFAVRGGFEPPVRLPVRQFSKLVVSATHPSHQTLLLAD